MRKHVETPPGVRQHHEQMLKLVAKSFYNELINYGVNEAEVLSVAGHLLDNVMQKSTPKSQPADYYNSRFAVGDVQNGWDTTRQLTLHEVSILPLKEETIPHLATWLKDPGIRESFYPRYPATEKELFRYFQDPTREYFLILHQNTLAGVIGGENKDNECGRLEMRKLVGDPQMHGKGIGKRATFLFLYYVFVIQSFQKVYLHSLDINIRNINLNGKFGFELEGVFLEEVILNSRRRDVVRMALTRARWTEIFGNRITV